MRRLAVTLFALVLTQGAAAQQAAPEGAFNQTWLAYVEARDTGDKVRTLETARAVLETARATFADDDERLPLLMSNYGTALRENRDYDAAREVLGEALELGESIHGKDSEKLIPVLMAYADSLAWAGRPLRQEERYKQALKIAKKHYGETSTEYAEVAFRAGVRVMELSKSTNAEGYFRDAYDIYAELKGPNSREAGLAAFYRGKVHYGRGHFKNATRYFNDALLALEGDAEYEMFIRASLVQAYENRGMSEEATEHCLAIGAATPLTPDQDYQPLFRAVPHYPRDMLASGREGHVDVEFEVDEQGFVRDPVVIARDGGMSFEKEALKAVEAFRYAPRFENGEPVAVDGVKTRITFQISSNRR